MITALYALLTILAERLLLLIGLFPIKGKVGAFIKGRKKKIPLQALPKTGKRYWFHCASLGEFEQARPLMERLKADKPDNSIVITFFSPSGYAQRFDYELADMVLYLPIDTPGNARRLLQYLQPDTAVFVKYELWYFHLKALLDNKIPVYLLSAVFRRNQFVFSALGQFIFKLLPRFSGIFVQDKRSFALLEEMGLNNILLSGDTRFDRVKQHALDVKENSRIKRFKADAPLLVLGSSWPEEENILLQYLQHTGLKFKVMLAPHDVSEAHVSELMNLFADYAPLRYTGSEDTAGRQLLILDTIGHLASAYCYADLAFIGGGFGRGLHNILEPLSFGVPVVFGPEVQKHPEAEMAIRNGVAMTCCDAQALDHAVRTWILAFETEIKVKCTDFINWHSGASEKVLKYMDSYTIAD